MLFICSFILSAYELTKIILGNYPRPSKFFGQVVLLKTKILLGISVPSGCVSLQQKELLSHYRNNPWSTILEKILTILFNSPRISDEHFTIVEHNTIWQIPWKTWTVPGAWAQFRRNPEDMCCKGERVTSAAVVWKDSSKLCYSVLRGKPIQCMFIAF